MRTAVQRSAPMQSGPSGRFHLMLPPAPGTSADTLARVFIGCPRIRRIVFSVADRRGVHQEFESILNDTFMACIPIFGQIDVPVNIYSYVYRTADNLALAAFRQAVQYESEELVTDMEEEEARQSIEPDMLERSPLSLLESREEETSTARHRARFREKLERSAFPKHISRDLEQNLRGTKVRQRGQVVQRDKPEHPLASDLRAIRSTLGLTISEFAERCSVPKARMWSYLRGLVQSDSVMNDVLSTARLLLPVTTKD
ncbi:hypothetical protein ACN8ZM_39730 (plasmid) [Burkholderia aenigmatica]|uniref:hypothetical protein n=1 Tax=Burkholderia aenigmatica TaxID=2015348 RepID=UPI003B431E8A